MDAVLTSQDAYLTRGSAQGLATRTWWLPVRLRVAREGGLKDRQSLRRRGIGLRCAFATQRKLEPVPQKQRCVVAKQRLAPVSLFWGSANQKKSTDWPSPNH